MTVSMAIGITKNCEVRRTTPEGYGASQQVALTFYPGGDGYSTVTFFAPTVVGADALVEAFVLLGAQKLPPLPYPANVTGAAQSDTPEATAK